MEFSKFLDEFGKQKKFSKTLDLFKFFGGAKILGVSERTFRAIVSGQINCTLNTFSAIFHAIPEADRKDAVVSYFSSSIESSDFKRELVSYFEEKLTVGFSQTKDALFTDSGHEPRYFSERQLKYLSSSNKVVRIFHRLVLHSPVPKEVFRDNESLIIVEELIRLGLAKNKGKFIEAFGSLFRFPNQDNSPIDLLIPANDFIAKHLEVFLVKEGARNEQELGFTFHTCSRNDARRILEQMQYFKRWVQSFGLKTDQPDEVGLVWLDFARILKVDRDY